MKTYRNNPNAVLPVRVRKEDDTTTLHENITAMLRQLTHHPEISYSIKPLTGGLTNVLYRATPSDSSEEFVVRFFGDGTEVFIDRSVENNVFAKLSQVHLAPSFVGLFENGRVEGMLDSRNLSCEDMTNPVLIPYIARSIAVLHKQNVDMDKTVDIWQKLGNFFELATDAFDAGKLKGRGGEVKEMQKEGALLKERISQLFVDCGGNSNSNAVDTDSSSIFEYQRGCQFAFERVLTHNDLLSGNILVNNDYEAGKEPVLTLIDYEYACYNTRAFDIANHFCEYAGFDFDIRTLFPSQDTRLLFLRSYAAEALGCAGTDVADQFLEGLDMVVMHCTLISHLFWGSWSAVQAACSDIDFDFIGYSDLRFDGYAYHKSQLRLGFDSRSKL